MFNILAALILSLSLPSMAEEIPGQGLLNYFSANCRSQGEWTKSALADSNALIETLRSIAQDPDCRSVGGAISQLSLLTSQLSNMEKINSSQSLIAEMNAKEQELLIHLSGTTDPTTLATINQNLRDLQVSRAGLLGKEKFRQELSGEDKVSALTSIVQIANSTFTQVTGNQKCLEKHPSVLQSATSIVSTIGVATTLVNPALGIGLTAGAAFLGETVEGVRKNRSARSIRKIADTSVAIEGYKCAIETMSDRWCQMKDAEAFLLFKANQRQKPIAGSGLAQAIRINDREVPALLEWLNKIKSGVTPTTTSDAIRQSILFQRESMLRSSEAAGLGVIEENRNIYETYTNLDERWTFLKTVIMRSIPSATNTSGVSHPFYDVLSIGYSPYFLLGISENDPTIKNDFGFVTLDAWKKPIGFNPTLQEIKDRYVIWIRMARNRVNQELNQVLQPDTLQTLSSAYDRTGNRWKISPMDALKNIVTFIEKNPPQEQDLAFKKLYSDTIKKLKEIYDITEQAIIEENFTNRTPVEEVYEIAQLRYGTIVIQTRLDMIIRLALLEYLQSAPQEEQVLVAQLLAAERFTETISRMSGTENLASIRADINRAQPITIANLNSFNDVFGNNINRILANLKNEELEAKGTVAKAKRYARTEFCFLLLGVPNVASKIDINLCEGLKFSAVSPGGPETQIISAKTFDLDYNDRACLYKDFFRKSKIYENWGIK